MLAFLGHIRKFFYIVSCAISYHACLHCRVVVVVVVVMVTVSPHHWPRSDCVSVAWCS